MNVTGQLLTKYYNLQCNKAIELIGADTTGLQEAKGEHDQVTFSNQH